MARILVADDAPAVLDVLDDILTLEGHEVVRATSGQEALRKFEDSSPDLAVLDIMMPDMDGYDTMRAIRKVAKFRSLPIIALTAKAMKGDREKCIEAGASDYISKPVDPEQLLALLRVWLYR